MQKVLREETKLKICDFTIAQGSLEECRYYCILSHDLGYGNATLIEEQLAEVSKLLDSYMKSILSSNY